MNLWARKSGLILLSALTFFSCEDDLRTVGLPPENDLGIFFVDVPLGDKVSQVWVDDAYSGSSGTLLAGSYTDQYFGQIEARNFSRLFITQTDPGKNIATNAVLDSMVLTTRIRGVSGENLTASTQVIEVYQLADTVAYSPLFKGYTTASSHQLGQKISEDEFILYPDSVELTWKDTGLKLESKEDTLFKEKFFDSSEEYIYKRSFRIDPAFTSDLFNKIIARDPAFSSDKNFNDFFNGIGFVSGQNNNAIIHYGAADTKMVMYYTETSSAGQKQHQIEFNLAQSYSYNNISPNKESGWMNSDFDNLSTLYTPYVTDTDLAYIQSGTNLLLKIDLSGFNEFVDTVGNPVLQRAELVFENLKSVSETTPVPTSLAYYITSLDSLANKNYEYSFLRDNRGSRMFAGYYKDKKLLNNDITLSLQNLLKEDTYNQLIIAPVNIINSQINPFIPNAKDLSRLVVSKDDIRLRIYYSIPDLNN